MATTEIEISMRARIFLTMQLREPKYLGKRKDENRLLNRDLYRKVAVPKDEMPLYLTPIQGGVALNMTILETAEPLKVELSRAEARRALTIANDWEVPQPDDDVWLDPFCEALEAAAK